MARKICIFCSHYFPYLGGVERYTYHLAKALMERGDKVVIVTSNDMHLETFTFMEGIPVFRMPCFNLLDGRYPVSKPDRVFWSIHRRLKQVGFDLVIIQTRFYLHSLYGIAFASRIKAKSIVLDHGTSHMTVGNRFADTVGGWFEHALTAVERMGCRDFYGVSKACCRWLAHFHIRAKGTLYNAVDAEGIEQMLTRPVRNFREEYGLQPEDIVVTYTGRLVKEKGILNLIKAVKDIPEEKRVFLMIAGDGEEWDAVCAKRSERICPLGRLSFEEVISLLGQTDIYCLPTDYPEGFPTSVLEAAAAGCYVVTTRRGGSQELILNEGYGMIMRDNRPETIRKALLSVLDDVEGRKAAAQRAKERLLKNFTWERTAGHIHHLGL